MEFCEEIIRRFDENNNFFDIIVFSNEASFKLHLSIADIGVTKFHTG